MFKRLFPTFFLGQIRDLQSSSGLVAGSPGPAVPCFPLPFAGSCMYVRVPVGRPLPGGLRTKGGRPKAKYVLYLGGREFCVGAGGVWPEAANPAVLSHTTRNLPVTRGLA